MISDSVSVKPQARIPRWVVVGFLVVGGLGFIDAAYLTVTHYRGLMPTCSLLHGCDAVLTSGFATLGFVPVALIGAIYYLTVFLLVFGYLDTDWLILLRAAAWLTVLGFLASLGFVYLQVFVIRALCQYCLLSALISTILFGLGMLVLKKCQRPVQTADVVE